MNLSNQTKKEIRDKASLVYGLTIVLKDDVDILRANVNDWDLLKLKEIIQDTQKTIWKISNVASELDRVISRNQQLL